MFCVDWFCSLLLQEKYVWPSFQQFEKLIQWNSPKQVFFSPQTPLIIKLPKRGFCDSSKKVLVVGSIPKSSRRNLEAIVKVENIKLFKSFKINIYIDLGRGPAERMKRFTSRSQCRRRSFGGCLICCWFSASEYFIINCIKRTQVIWRSYPVPNSIKTWPATWIFLIPNMTRFSFENPRVSGKRNIGYYPIFWVNPERAGYLKITTLHQFQRIANLHIKF